MAFLRSISSILLRRTSSSPFHTTAEIRIGLEKTMESGSSEYCNRCNKILKKRNSDGRRSSDGSSSTSDGDGATGFSRTQQYLLAFTGTLATGAVRVICNPYFPEKNDTTEIKIEKQRGKDGTRSEVKVTMKDSAVSKANVDVRDDDKGTTIKLSSTSSTP